MEKYKVCKKCGELFPATEEYFQSIFYKNRGKSYLSNTCKKCRTEYNKRYWKENSEKAKKYMESYREENKDRLYEQSRERARRYYHNNRDTVLESNRQYRKNHEEDLHEYHRQYEQKRRSRKKQLKATLTRKEWDIAKREFGNACAYCGANGKLTQDHFLALTNGGTYTKANIIPSCARCNSSKSNKQFSDWYGRQEFYDENREKHILEYIEKEKAK